MRLKAADHSSTWISEDRPLTHSTPVNSQDYSSCLCYNKNTKKEYHVKVIGGGSNQN